MIFVNNLLIWPGEDWNLGREECTDSPEAVPGVCGYSPHLLSISCALERVSPGRNTQQIHRQLLQAGIPCIIYIHHLKFVALIPPAQHKTWRFITALTLLLISWSLQSELPPTQWHREELWVRNFHLQRRDKLILKLWIISLSINIRMVYREPFKPEQLQDSKQKQMYFDFCGIVGTSL